MSRRRAVGNVLGLAVLSYLTQGPMHPYELVRSMRGHGDDRSVKFTHGSVYMVVEQLERAGFIAEQGTSRDGLRPERTVYALTDEGRAELRDWMQDLVAVPRYEYPHFVAALSLIGALPPHEVVALLSRRLDGLAVLRAEAARVIDSAVGAGVHPLYLVEEEYRITQLDADAAFTRRFLERIEGPEGWAAAWDQHGHTGANGETGETPGDSDARGESDARGATDARDPGR